MFIGVLVKPGDDIARDEGTRVLRALQRQGVDHTELGDASEARGDVLVVVGDNAFLSAAVRRLPSDVPVLGVGSSGFGVLTEVTVEGFESNVRRLVQGNYRVEAVDRMTCRVGERVVPALNEVALVGAEPAEYVRYSLWVADELVWRDRGDGVIIATPTGSTAYALAAGGPVVLGSRTTVFSVVPICSSSGRPPVVVSEDAAVTITDAFADAGLDLVADGRDRVRVGRGETVRVTRSPTPARFVRLGAQQWTQMLGKLKTSRAPAVSLKDAPPSAKFILKLLEYEGPLTQQEMVRESDLSERTVRNAVHHLYEHGVIQKAPSLRDARQDVYALRTPSGPEALRTRDAGRR